MDDFANILERDYGLRPQGKSAPMSGARPGPVPPRVSPSTGPARNGTNLWSSTPTLNDEDLIFGGNAAKSASSSRPAFGSTSGADLLGGGYDDVFGGPPKYTSSVPGPQSVFNQGFDDVFSSSPKKSVPTPPSYSAPVYDDDIFGGMPGVRSAATVYEDVFNVGGAPAPSKSTPSAPSAAFDSLLGDFGSTTAAKANSSTSSKPVPPPAYDTAEAAFDDDGLLPGFGKAEPVKSRSTADRTSAKQKPPRPVSDYSSNAPEDPFSVFDTDSAASRDPPATAPNIDVFETSSSTLNGRSRRNSVNDVSDNIFNFDNGSAASVNPGPDVIKPSDAYVNRKSSRSQSPVNESVDSTDAFGGKSGRRTPPEVVKPDRDTYPGGVEYANVPLHRSVPQRSAEGEDSFRRRQSRESTGSPAHVRNEASPRVPKVVKNVNVDEYWISIEDIKLVTQPTAGPPPSRPPPVPGARRAGASRRNSSQRMDVNPESFWENGGSVPSGNNARTVNGKSGSLFDELDDFASGGVKSTTHENTSSPIVEDDQMEGSAAATASGAAMKEAIERAEAKLRQAKETKDKDREERGDREREDTARAAHEREEREREEREREARERRHREREREREEREKEKEREREKEREKDRANELARQRAAVERANAEVRAREAQKAAERAADARSKAERIAVERATAEARQRAERAALEKARAAAAEKAAAEKAAAEKAAAEKAAAERAAAEKAQRERTVQEQQRRNGGDDLESFFMSSSRPTSAPKQRTQDMFNETRQSSEGQWKSSTSSSNVKKVPSMPTMADDLSSLFGGPPAPGEFQEIEGESADRRKARWERHQRTMERAAKALDEKKQRDMRMEMEQAERHRAADLVDAEIKRWAAGKEGNLRALLSTLQYVLWPECGWRPVSLTDLITAAAVKKVYKKATLCVHPDKVQQKGATIQQKYIAEKVFDLLKEAWNKFNSEELF